MPCMTLDSTALSKVARDLAGQGKKLILPVREVRELFYREGADPEALDLSTIPKNSIKEFLFPKCDPILK